MEKVGIIHNRYCKMTLKEYGEKLLDLKSDGFSKEQIDSFIANSYHFDDFTFAPLTYVS